MLVNALACPWYFPSILIWAFFFLIEVSYASLLNMPLRVALNVACVWVLPLFRYLSFWFGFQWNWNYSSLSAFQKNSRSRQGRVFVAISDTLSCLFFDGLAFGIQSLHVNYKYSLPAILFTLLWKSYIHRFISESDTIKYIVYSIWYMVYIIYYILYTSTLRDKYTRFVCWGDLILSEFQN